MKIDQIEPTPSVALADLSRQLKAEGKNIITLQTGEPDFDTPLFIKNQVKLALDKNRTKYSFSSGLPELKSLIAKTYKDSSQLNIDKDQFIITAGAVQGIASVISAIVELNDEVIILEPAWPTIKSLVINNGGIPKCISFLDKENLLKNIEEQITSNTKLIYLNFPNNPTGQLITSKLYVSILELLKKYNILVISDEVYEFFDFTEDPNYKLPPERLEYENFICINSFSKKYCMTGFRIGYIYTKNLENLKKIALASQINVTNIPEFTQYAAISAISHPKTKNFTKKLYKVFKQRFEIINKALINSKISALDSGGAFYKFIFIGMDDKYFSEKLLLDYSVCVVPGSAYGSCGRNYIRITFAEDLDQVMEGLRRITELYNKLK